MYNYHIGIDISKLKFNVALMENKKFKTKVFSNNTKGFVVFKAWLEKYKIETPHVCMEATGRYSESLATFLFNDNVDVSVVNPAQIKYFGSSQLKRTKTDKADSKLIAEYCCAMNPKLWNPKPAHIRQQRELVMRTESLKNLIRQEKNRLELASKCIRKSINKVLRSLEKELDKIEAAIKSNISKYDDLKKKSELLASIPGIGTTTINYILSFIGNVEDFQNCKQLVAYLGLNPKQHQSGTSINGQARISKMDILQSLAILHYINFALAD